MPIGLHTHLGVVPHLGEDGTRKLASRRASVCTFRTSVKPGVFRVGMGFASGDPGARVATIYGSRVRCSRRAPGHTRAGPETFRDPRS